MSFGLIQKTVSLIKKRFKNPYILIQTNGTLLTDERLDYIKEQHINLEFGVDGLAISTLKHRRKTTPKSYTLLIKHLTKALTKGIGVSCTMTVHPSEAALMQENFSFLNSLNIPSIEITPAVFEQWTEESKNSYLEQYGAIVQLMKSKGKQTILSSVYDRPLQHKQLDIIVTGTGKILPSWVSLSLPREAKQYHAYYDKGSINTKILANYLSLYQKFYTEENRTF